MTLSTSRPSPSNYPPLPSLKHILLLDTFLPCLTLFCELHVRLTFTLIRIKFLLKAQCLVENFGKNPPSLSNSSFIFCSLENSRLRIILYSNRAQPKPLPLNTICKFFILIRKSNVKSTTGVLGLQCILGIFTD